MFDVGSTCVCVFEPKDFYIASMKYRLKEESRQSHVLPTEDP